jgi:hypothetical protein
VGFALAADKEDVWILLCILKPFDDHVYGEVQITWAPHGTMPSVLNFVVGQETPRLKRTDQIQQSHAWIYHAANTFIARPPLV